MGKVGGEAGDSWDKIEWKEWTQSRVLVKIYWDKVNSWVEGSSGSQREAVAAGEGLGTQLGLSWVEGGGRGSSKATAAGGQHGNRLLGATVRQQSLGQQLGRSNSWHKGSWYRGNSWVVGNSFPRPQGGGEGATEHREWG